MPQATFYTHVSDCHLFACRLTARAVQSGSRVLVWTEDGEAAEKLNLDLWSYEPTAFLPHEIWYPNQPQPEDAPVLVTFGQTFPALQPGRVVLNLSPDFWCDAVPPPERVLEIVGIGLEDLDEARKRFSAYKRQGFDITHHNRQGKD